MIVNTRCYYFSMQGSLEIVNLFCLESYTYIYVRVFCKDRKVRNDMADELREAGIKVIKK